MSAKRLDKLIASGLMGAVAFTALAHGAVEPWSIVLFELLIILLLFFWGLKSLMEKRFVLMIPVMFLPIAGFFIYGLIQSIARIDEHGQISSLSIDVESTRSSVMLLFFLAASFLIAANFLATENRLQTFLKFIIVFGFLLAVFSLIQYFTKESVFFWSRPSNGTNPLLTGPFVNHNHFAGYLELIIPLPTALILTSAEKEKNVIYGFAAGIMTLASILSVSRAGMISQFVGLLFVAALSYRFIRLHRVSSGKKSAATNPRQLSSAPLVRFCFSALLVVSVIVAGVMWVGKDSVLRRLPGHSVTTNGGNSETFESSRGWIWKNSFAIFLSNPICGTGMGTFETAFPQYSEGFESDGSGKLVVWNRAHNDYLQVLTDTGLIGGLLALWFTVIVAITIVRSFHYKSRFHAGLSIGCGGAIISLFVHSVFDYNLQLPSTSLLFLILTAVSTNLAKIHDQASLSSRI